MKFLKKYFPTTEKKVIGIFFTLAIILVLRLFVLSIIQNSEWSDAANSLSIKGIYTQSPRGNIYDRNGELLAGNEQIFSVRMSAGTMENSEINKIVTELLAIFDENDDDYESDFPIEISDGKFSFTYDNEIKSWLSENNISTSATAEEALYALADKLGIESDDRYEIQAQLQNTYGVYPPIAVKNMKYTAQKEKEEFLDSYNLDDDVTAAEAFAKIRKKFEIADSISDKQALKIMGIRAQINSTGYKKYMPATIATDVSKKTLMEVEENSSELKGVDVVSSSKRYYPNGNLASHILGYMGKISSDEKDEYEAKGYETSALVGQQGIEGIYESVLKGQDGTQLIRVNAHGEYVKTLSEIESEKGKDIYLTIDSDLQKIAEEALEKNIKACRGGVFTSEFGNISLTSANNAKTGAVVAIEVETGDVLAMANYPDFDPNLFSEGISSYDWESLQSENPRDSLAQAPLYNIATMSAIQPGSTFKPITATAALENGFNANTTLQDKGYIKLGDRTFGCVLWNVAKSNHGYINLYKAIQVSCNYYFYDLITNKDWATGNSLGMNSKMGIDEVMDYAKQFGLGQSTGIELAENTSFIPTEERKVKGLQNSLKNILYANAESYFEETTYSNQKKLDRDIETIVGWLKKDEITYKEMKNELLPSVGIKESKYEDMIQLCLYDYFNQAKWTTGDAFNLAIGQGDNAYTPLQIANYLATLGNDGVRNQVSIVKSIEDEGTTTKGDTTKVDVKKSTIEAIKKGMNGVTKDSDSGISSHYASFPWEVCAKTGTAQKDGYVNPESEVDYIKQHLSSFGNMSWSEVQTEMKRLMKTYPDTYTSEDVAVRRAVINLSGGKLTSEDLNKYKSTYDEFAWTMAMAPMDDPKIAVVCVIPQGVTGGNANPVVREIIGQYLKSISPEYSEDDFKIVNEFD